MIKNSELAEALRGDIEHVHHVWATHPDWDAEIPLDVVSATVTFDEENAPYATASLGVRVPEDVEVIDLLDPRHGVQIEVDSGYVLPGGQEVLRPFAKLDLRSRVVQRPDDLMMLTAAGYELRVQDNPAKTATEYASGVSGPWAIADRLDAAAPGSAPVKNYMPPTPFTTDLIMDELLPNLPVGRFTEEVGTDSWTTIQDIADRIGAWVYYDGLGAWIIEPVPDISEDPAYTLGVGEDGTLLSTEALLGRDDFYNAVTVIQEDEWSVVTGHAEVAAGPFGTRRAGTKRKVVRRNFTTAQKWATEAAKTLVARGVSRGRSVSVEAAAAAYWLRPGHTVEIALPTGLPERHLVSRVDFDLPTGTMHVATRVPLDVVIETGE